jgi:hypothetical protein
MTQGTGIPTSLTTYHWIAKRLLTTWLTKEKVLKMGLALCAFILFVLFCCGGLIVFVFGAQVDDDKEGED